MTPADTLYGTSEVRIARFNWAAEYMRQSTTLYACAEMHIQGQISYRTALLTAVDMLSANIIRLGEISKFNASAFIPTEQEMASAAGRHGTLERVILGLCIHEARLIQTAIDYQTAHGFPLVRYSLSIDAKHELHLTKEQLAQITGDKL